MTKARRLLHAPVTLSPFRLAWCLIAYFLIVGLICTLIGLIYQERANLPRRTRPPQQAQP